MKICVVRFVVRHMLRPWLIELSATLRRGKRCVPSLVMH
jgi:hypothetical protein